MDTQITIAYDAGLGQALAQLDQAPAAIQRAKRRALTKLSRWLSAALLRAVSAAARLPQSKIRAAARFRTTLGRDHLAVWIGTDDVRVRYFGGVSWSRRMAGARAGGKLYPHSWAWDYGKTKGLVMERLSDARLPIAEVVESIHPRVLAAVQALQPQVEARYLSLLSDELGVAIGVPA